jgi:hypothetical protein
MAGPGEGRTGCYQICFHILTCKLILWKTAPAHAAVRGPSGPRSQVAIVVDRNEFDPESLADPTGTYFDSTM